MKKKIQIAIDSPAASGAGTQAKLISKHYKLFYLDTGKSYRVLAKEYLKNKNKINIKKFKDKLSNLRIKDFSNKNLLSSEIGLAASYLAKDIRIREVVDRFQKKIVVNISKKYQGICLDGRDITYNIMPDADVKFFLTASIKVRALRRTKELRKNGFNVSINEVYKSIKNRDKSDYSRSVAPLKITKDAIKINTTNLTIRKTFLILKDKIDKKIIL
ncbi:(d)CMP kinase [Candidatus Pelagibacter sp. Uisw_136]|uniref:(d)CMP kinase n=1 Tax=Candidatus Pelagibacter sp. Uisw_136 TaxID=3230991 RepID=UPI0039E9B59B